LLYEKRERERKKAAEYTCINNSRHFSTAAGFKHKFELFPKIKKIPKINFKWYKKSIIPS
jgi:hypothetical protein